MTSTSRAPHSHTPQPQLVRRNIAWISLLVVLAAGALIAALWYLSSHPKSGPTLGMNSAVKEHMVAQLYPAIHAQNLALLATRKRLLALQPSTSKPLTASTRGWLIQLAIRYRLALPDTAISSVWLKQLATRVDIIPADLALAQAASESAWGRSRFARIGNNYFGIWCFSEGCGMIPKQRPAGAHYAVRTFPNIEANVRAYMLNINSHDSYRHLRRLRAILRSQHKPITGIILSRGLGNYSAIGQQYIGQLQGIIRHNDLARFNRLGR